MSDKTITITVPDIADWRERILWLANAANNRRLLGLEDGAGEGGAG
jgi:hypothetical protein